MEVTKQGTIIRIDGLIDPLELNQVLGWISQNEGRFERSKIFFENFSEAQQETERRSSYSLFISKDNDVMIDSILYNVFKRALAKYVETLSTLPIKVKDDEGYQVVRYLSDENGKYDVHVDDHSASPRRVSGLLYLNSGYEGGELWFPAQDIKIKPQAGTIVMFPSGFEYPHASLPVTSGEKMVITTWYM